jgi:polyhydroxybutyrate depolymerase
MPIARSALVHIPTSLPAHRRAPVVITFHGAQLTADFQASFDGVNQLADSEGFISVHPQGLIIDLFGTPTMGWDVYNPNTNEPAFVAALLDELTTTLCVDPHRIYAIGFSQGGGMAQLAACVLDGRFAAIASIEALPARPCPTAPPVPVVAFHGLQDLVVPYDTGLPAVGLPPTPTTLQVIATRNGCTTEPPDVRHINTNVDQLRWENCDAPTELYRINQHGHSWPGHPYGLTEAQWEAFFTATGTGIAGLTTQQAATTLALTSNNIDATAVAWHFFRHLTKQHRYEGGRA